MFPDAIVEGGWGVVTGQWWGHSGAGDNRREITSRGEPQRQAEIV